MGSESCLTRLGLEYSEEASIGNIPGATPRHRSICGTPRRRPALDRRCRRAYPFDDDCLIGEGNTRIVAWRDDQPVLRLAPGKRGATISHLQEQLRALGYYTETIDGIVGPPTLAAFQAFQGDAALPPSRLVDAWTHFLLSHGTAHFPELDDITDQP